MRKIFVFWIIFFVMLIAGITLVLGSKAALKREERKAERLKKAVVLQLSRTPQIPTAGEVNAGVVPQSPPSMQPLPSSLPAPPIIPLPSSPSPPPLPPSLPAQPVIPPMPLDSSGELPPIKDIPVQINTDSLEMDISQDGSTDLTTPSNSPEQSQADEQQEASVNDEEENE